MAEPQVGTWLDCRARITSNELAPLHSVRDGILQNACSTRPRVVASLGKSALMRLARLMNSLAKGLKRTVTKVQCLCCKLHDNWVAYSRIWSRRSLHRLYGRAQICGNRFRCVQFTKAVARHANIRDQNPSLGMICHVILISATPMLQNLRIGFKKRQNGKSDVPVKQRGG